MLEIASEIIVCLLIAATIGAAIGYLICKSLSEKADPVAAEPHTEEKAAEKEKEVIIEETPEVSQEAIQESEEVAAVEIEDKSITEEVETPTEAAKEVVTEEIPEVSQEAIEEVLETEEESTTEEVEIPTEAAIEKALEALEEIDVQEEEILEVEEVPAKKPELLSSPRNSKKDNLTQIKGIGPKVEEKLNEAGIYHFDQIANWTEKNIQWLEENTVFAHRAKKDLWTIQAKALV